MLPFYYDNQKDNEYSFDKADFDKYEMKTKYLVKSVYELFVGDEPACNCFCLRDDARENYDLPRNCTEIKMVSDMIGCEGEFSFILSTNRIFIFSSGIGFVETEIQYLSDDVDTVANIGFCFANIFTNEHDKSQKPNHLQFSYIKDGKNVNFSLKNALLKILDAENHTDTLKLFPSSERKRLLSECCSGVL